MPELPRLKQFTDIAVVPRPTPDPGVASQLSQATAQGASQLSTIFGHITAKDVELSKQERDLTSRFAAEHAAFNATQDFITATDQIKTGKIGYENFPNIPEFAGGKGPIQTDDLMLAYRETATSIRGRYVDALQTNGHGALAGYAFANEYDTNVLSYSQKLHTDRDQRKVGELQSAFDDRATAFKKQVAIGILGPAEAKLRYDDEFNKVAPQIYTPQQAQLRRDKDHRDIRMAPTMQMMADGKSPDLFEQLETGELSKQIARGESSLLPADLPDLREALLKDIWQTQSYRSAKEQEKKRAFNERSDNYAKTALAAIRDGKYTRADLEGQAAELSRENYDFIDKAILSQEQQGGPGNPVMHSNTKLNIALYPNTWSPERISNYSSQQGMNSGETLDLINELFKANQQRKNAENDANHFSKDHRYKEYKNGMRKDLGISPFAVLKPQDENMAQQAEYDYMQAFQIPYDKGQPLPDFEEAYKRVVKRYRPRFSWVTEQVPYDNIQQAAEDYKNGRITTQRLIEVDEILKKQEEMARQSQKVE